MQVILEHNIMISAQMLCWQKSLLILMLLTSCSAQSTYYVTPTPDTPCPGEPCHTLSQYGIEQYFTGNVLLMFLPGNHTLEQTISLENQLSLQGDSSSFPEVTSRIMVNVCDSQTRRGFVFAGNTELHISVLAFISGVCGGGIAILESEQQSRITFSIFINISLYVHKSILTVLTGNTFQNTESPALNVQYSSLELMENIFQDNSAAEGGALLAQDSALNLVGNTFQENSAKWGGALHVKYSTLDLTGNIFQDNSADVGGALFTRGSTLNLTGNAFQGNSANWGDNWGGALHVQYSTLDLTGNIFQDNSADVGGALFTRGSTLNLTGNAFQGNSAYDGGALDIQYGNLNLIGNTFQNNSAHDGGVLFVDSGNLNLTGNIFQDNSADVGGALFMRDSTLNLTGNAFQGNSANRSYNWGGALHVQYSTLNLTGNAFQGNSADDGGALHAQHSTLNIIQNIFQDNSANWGGALRVEYSNLNFTENIFQNNLVSPASISTQQITRLSFGGVLSTFDSNCDLIGNTFQDNSAHYNSGGVLNVQYGNLNLVGNTFQNNSAGQEGGALSVDSGNLNLTGNTFHSNSADLGGVFYVENSILNLTGNTFHSNSADQGGVLYVLNSNLNFTRNTFQSNSAIGSGGTLLLEASNITFTDTNFTDSYASSGGAIAAAQSSHVRLYGNNNFIANNTAQYGGGIAIVDCQLELVGSVFTVQNNTASYGGGLYIHNTSISGNVTFNANSATEGGGGIYASRSTVYFMGNTTFMENSAIDGGGLLLSDDSKFYLQQNTHVYFTSNSAKRNGGAIKVEESNFITYCMETYKGGCFFQIQTQVQIYTNSEVKKILSDLNVIIYFENNSAVEAGADLHGGSVDNCELNNIEIDHVFDNITSCENKYTPDISSYPLHICTCRDNQVDCSGSYHPEPVYPGGTLEVPVIARGQRNGSTTAKIQVINIPDNKIILHETETIQNTNKNCTTLKYTIQSTAKHSTQEMTLYAEGPCPPKLTIHPSATKIKTILNTLKVLIDILDCPPGFHLSQTQTAICICTDRLQQFTNTCLVDDKTVLREYDAQFWVGYDNHSRGVILHPHCPFDYCTSEEIYMVVDDSDKQCNYNRSGLLCGSCSENLSLALGSSRCLQCSNSFIALLVTFAFAGLALVVFLLVLRLTVATGTINGLIFYANVVAVNSAIFFQPQATNVPAVFIARVLTVFIAWLNLDVGIETCFYYGMDAYIKMWLQFIFPLYVWILVGMIILGSHYSGRVAKMFGSNPIAVLATLFLLSYAKLLRTVIASLAYTFLEYPNNSRITVWLYDGNIRYLAGKHIPLFTVAVICLIFLFLPYTMLLIFSQWLQEFSIFSWINGHNFRPFLDAYHAPYTYKHRYWTGLMLLFRFVLFLISAVNALGDPSVNLLAISSATIAILTLSSLLSTTIYKTWCLSLLEISFILNLAILSVASYHVRLAGGNQNTTTLTSVSIAFALFTGIVIYHSIEQIKGTRLWRRVRLRHDHRRGPPTDVASGHEDPPDAVFTSGCAPTQTVVAICEYELREPLIATD